MADLQLLFVIAFITIPLLAMETPVPNFATPRPGKDPKCHHPNFSYKCMNSLYEIPNSVLNGWFYYHPFKSCHPMYSLGGVHHCNVNENLPRTRAECEYFCAEPCTMDNGTAGICTFEQYCPKRAHTHTFNLTPCKAHGVRCCLPQFPLKYILPITSIHPANDEVVINNNGDQLMEVFHDVHDGDVPKLLRP